MLKELEIMYYNEIHLCISWNNKSSSFPEKCWYQQNSSAVYHKIWMIFVFSLGKVYLCQL